MFGAQRKHGATGKKLHALRSTAASLRGSCQGMLSRALSMDHAHGCACGGAAFRANCRKFPGLTISARLAPGITHSACGRPSPPGPSFACCRACEIRARALPIFAFALKQCYCYAENVGTHAHCPSRHRPSARAGFPRYRAFRASASIEGARKCGGGGHFHFRGLLSSCFRACRWLLPGNIFPIDRDRLLCLSALNCFAF